MNELNTEIVVGLIAMFTQEKLANASGDVHNIYTLIEECNKLVPVAGFESAEDVVDVAANLYNRY